MGINWIGTQPKIDPQHEEDRQKMLDEVETINEGGFSITFLKMPKITDFKKFEDVKKLEYTTDQVWDIIFWSFYNAPGIESFQGFLLEWIRRKIKIPIDFDYSKPPERIIELAIRYRQNDDHKEVSDFNASNMDAEKEKTTKTIIRAATAFQKNTDLIESTFFSKITNPLHKAKQQIRDLRNSYNNDNTYLMNQIAKYFIAVSLDQKRRNRIVRINGILNEEKQRGGEIFNLFFTDLRAELNKIINSPANDEIIEFERIMGKLEIKDGTISIRKALLELGLIASI